VRPEGGKATGDPAADEAYKFSGKTWDFYYKILNRNSLDDQGLKLVSSVHAGTGYDNAFWDGVQMVYGDGDGIIFERFTRSIDVVGHELTHGVVQHTCGLIYFAEPGALNEHFTDVFGTLVRQYAKKQSVTQADWLIGAEILVKAPTRTALRSMKDPGSAFTNDPDLGDDPQPKHYSKRYTGGADNGGVHINSGIPNYAFYLAATDLGGKAWTRAGKVWYKAMLNLLPQSTFADCARETRAEAANLFPADSAVAKAVDQAWKQVGL
jgi:Zn-dependent metalloprotease